MEMADNPKLDINSGCGMEENLGAQKISVSDHANGFQCSNEKSDSFVIDMDSFSHGSIKDITPNSRITLQRSLSRKGSQRNGERKTVPNTSVNDKDATSSPRAILVGSSTSEKPPAMAVGTMDHSSSSNPQVHHHQITVTTGSIATITESRCVMRRNSSKRPSSWFSIDPRKVLIFFASLSSMGTLMLIYFTLSINKFNSDENIDWQQ